MPNLFGSQTVTVYVTWNDSGAAIQSLTGNGTCNFFASTSQGNTNLVAASADIGFAVVYQSDYAYPTPVLTDSTYGCTPTIFARSVNAPASITNLTSRSSALHKPTAAHRYRSSPAMRPMRPLTSTGSCATSARRTNHFRQRGGLHG